jgi:hypothetical protein
MEKFQEGSAIGIRSKSILGWIIRLFTNTKYNHFAIVTKNSNGVLCLSEAIEEGIVFSPLNTYNNTKKYNIIERQPIFEYDLKIIQEEAKEHFGDPYDIIDLVIEQPINIESGFWIGNKSEKKWICVKWVMYCYWKASNGKYFTNWYEDNNSRLMGSQLKTI